jgi:hypothetical protein
MKLRTWAWKFLRRYENSYIGMKIPTYVHRYENSYAGMKLQTQVRNFQPKYETSFPETQLVRNRPQLPPSPLSSVVYRVVDRTWPSGWPARSRRRWCRPPSDSREQPCWRSAPERTSPGGSGFWGWNSQSEIGRLTYYAHSVTYIVNVRWPFKKRPSRSFRK